MWWLKGWAQLRCVGGDEAVGCPADKNNPKRNLLLLLLLWLSSTKGEMGGGYPLFSSVDNTLMSSLSLLLLHRRRYYSLAQWAARHPSLVRSLTTSIATFRDSLHKRDIYTRCAIEYQLTGGSFTAIPQYSQPFVRRAARVARDVRCANFFRNSQSVVRTPWLRRRVHAPTSKSSNQPIAGMTGTVRHWSIITALVSTRPCEPWKVKDNLCRHKIKYFYGAHIV
jgi:hypothetical protein